MTEHHSGISIRAAALSFGLDIQSARRMSGGFSGAAVFQIRDRESRFFAMRLVPLGLSLPEPRLDLLCSLLSRIQQSGQRGIAVPLRPTQNVSSPAILLSQQGHSSCVTGGFRVLVEPWIDGEPIDVPNRSQLSDAITYVSSLHQRLRLAVTELPANEWFFVRTATSPGLCRRSQIISDLLNGELSRLLNDCSRDRDPEFRKLASRTADVVKTWLPQLKSLTTTLESHVFPIQPILRDVWRPHVLFHNDVVTGVIDLTSAASDHLVLDYARLFRSWYCSDHAGMLVACHQAADCCKMTTRERQLLQCIDACSTILSPVTWLKRRVGSSREQPLEEGVRFRMEEVVRNAESFSMLPM